MAFVSFKNIRLSGLSAAVPKKVVENAENTKFPADDIQKFMDATGVQRFRMAEDDVCTSDLCYVAADKLLNELKWDRNEVEMLLFISQGPDYILPNTAPILQEKLKLPKTCIAFDMTLGCSAYVYGLSVVASMMSAGTIKKALFLCGDVTTKNSNKKDPSTAMLFGDAGTATALEYDTTAGEMQFSLGSDGSGYDSIIVPYGAARNSLNTVDRANYALQEEVGTDGITRNKSHLILDGMNVFSFGITHAPASVKETTTYFNEDPAKIDFYVFHQANLMMNEIVRRKLKLSKEKVPYSLKNFGNTSSASVPLTVITEIREELTDTDKTMLFCGFGVGLSWGSCIVKTKNLVIPELIEV